METNFRFLHYLFTASLLETEPVLPWHFEAWDINKDELTSADICKKQNEK